MDDQRFDRLSRELAGVGSRRGLIRASVALVLGGIGVGAGFVVGGPEAESAICRPVGRYCTRDGQCCGGVCTFASERGRARRYTCGCATGLTVCRQACVDLMSDPRNCGRCGRACASGVCVEGVCRSGSGQATAVATAQATKSAEACTNTSETSPLCITDTAGVDHYGKCAIGKTVFVLNQVGVVQPCTANADCTDAFNECEKATETCFCATSGRIYQDSTTYTVGDWYNTQSVSVCARISTDVSQCFNGGLEMGCSNLGTICTVNDDCCHVNGECSTAGLCVFKNGASCNNNNNECHIGSECTGNVCTQV